MDLFLLILYIGLIILVVVAIIFLIRAMNTLKKVDKVVAEVDEKVSKLNGVFELLDTATDAITLISDKVVGGLANGISKMFNKKKKGEDDE